MKKITGLLFVCMTVFCFGICLADAPYLYGIHWYGSVSSTDVETMSAGKGVYDVEQVFTDTATTGNIWETAPYKVSPFNTIIGKGHTIIGRFACNWARNIPKTGDTYSISSYANDAKIAADTLKNQCHTWILGNEDNLTGENSAQYSPEYYAGSYRTLRNAFHQVTSSLGDQTLCITPMSPGIADGSVRFMDSNEYLYRILTTLTPSEVDGFAIHAYATPGVPVAQCLKDFQKTMREQLMVMDQLGYTTKPVYITEWNKHMPNMSEVSIASPFLYQEYNELYKWNTTAGHHNIVSASWFVYPDDSWTDYSLLYWKSHASNTTKEVNPWYAFQYAAQQSYPKGTAGGGVWPANNALYFEDAFNGSSLDTDPEAPQWTLTDTANGGTVTVSGGQLLLKGNGSANAMAFMRTDGYVYGNFSLYTRMTVVNETPRGGEANTEIRFREGSGGYSLTMDALNNQIKLRKVNVWSTYTSQAVTINTGDYFDIKIVANGSNIQIQIKRNGESTPSVNWNLTNTDYNVGWIRMGMYMIEEVRYYYVRVGGVNYIGTGIANKEWQQMGK